MVRCRPGTDHLFLRHQFSATSMGPGFAERREERRTASGTR